MNPPDEEDVQHLVAVFVKCVSHAFDMPFSHSNKRQRKKVLRAATKAAKRKLLDMPFHRSPKEG